MTLELESSLAQEGDAGRKGEEGGQAPGAQVAGASAPRGVHRALLAWRDAHLAQPHAVRVLLHVANSLEQIKIMSSTLRGF